MKKQKNKLRFLSLLVMFSGPSLALLSYGLAMFANIAGIMAQPGHVSPLASPLMGVMFLGIMLTPVGGVIGIVMYVFSFKFWKKKEGQSQEIVHTDQPRESFFIRHKDLLIVTAGPLLVFIGMVLGSGAWGGDAPLGLLGIVLGMASIFSGGWITLGAAVYLFMKFFQD